MLVAASCSTNAAALRPDDAGDVGAMRDAEPTSDGAPTTDAAGPRLPGDRWIRINPLGAGSRWNLPGYTPAQIVQLVARLQPDFLDRFTNGPQDPGATLDATGLTVAQFLQEVLDAERHGGTFSSRVDLLAYDADPAAWLQMTQALRDIAVTPAPYVLSVDDWVIWINRGHTPAQGQAIIQALHAQGWKMVQVTQCGVFDMDGHGDYTSTCVDAAHGWSTHASLVTELAQYYPQIELYMDFPTPMDQYCVLDAGQQAAIVDHIAASQAAWGVTYVYPFLARASVGGGTLCYFDTSQITLPSGGTLLDHQLELMNVYNP